MEDLMIGGDGMAEEEESWPKKPTLIKPLPLRVQPKLLFGVGSSFKPWKRPFGDINNGHNGNNNAEVGLTISNTNRPRHRLANSSNSTHVEDHANDEDMYMENYSTEKNPINEIGANSGDDHNTDMMTDHEVIEFKQDQPRSGGNTNSEMDPKRLKRMMSNRLSAKRSRDKKNAYVAELEEKAKTYQEKIVFINPQIVDQKTRLQSLQIEHHTLKLLMAAREKERVLQEAIEKNRAEVERLRRKLNMKLTAEADAKMDTASLQISSDSNLYPPALRHFIHNNSPQDLNGSIQTSTGQADSAQQAQDQSQIMMDSRLRSIPDLNLVKSEPES